MAKDQLILPRADSRCGKAFYSDPRVAESHRIALEFWNQATGQSAPVISWQCTAASVVEASTSASAESRNRL